MSSMVEFPGYPHQPIFRCRDCRNPIAYRRDLISKSFLTKLGPGYLFNHAMNVVVGQKEEKQLMTGIFAIADIYCSRCGQAMGWKYVEAFEARERFKEGKFVIEKAKIVKEY